MWRDFKKTSVGDSREWWNDGERQTDADRTARLATGRSTADSGLGLELVDQPAPTIQGFKTVDHTGE